MSDADVDSQSRGPSGPLLSLPRVPLTPLKKLSIRPAVSPAVNLKQPLFAPRTPGKASSGFTLLNHVKPVFVQDVIPTYSEHTLDSGIEQRADLVEEDDEAFAVDQLCDDSFVSCDSSTATPREAELAFETLDASAVAARAVVSPKASTAAQLSDLFSADSPPPAQVAYRTPQSSPEILYRYDPLVELSDTSDDEAVAPGQRRGSPSSAGRKTGRATPLFAPSGSDTDQHVHEASRYGTPEGSRRSRSPLPLGSDHDGELDTEQPEWMERYYDDSEGSLRDFIVDDEHEEEGLDSDDDLGDDDDDDAVREISASGEDDLGKVRPRNRPRCSYPAQSESEASFRDPAWDEESVGGDEEDDEDGAVTEWSPGPSRPRKRDPLLDFEALTLSDSDEDSAGPSDTSSPPRSKRETSKRSKAKTAAKKPSARMWAAERVELANGIFRDLDRKVFDKQLGPEGAGAKIEWSKRLLTTAGTASEPRVRQSDGSMKREPKITLSEKVCTGREQILSTVAHEMCHLAAWVISNERKNPHGRVFKSWGQKVMKARRDIEVTTKHSYQIEYKYQWQCVETDCQRIYKRHSKSIDITKQACGRCRGKLRPMFETKENPFQTYLKNNMALAKASMPLASHGDVMRALSRRWTEAGPSADHEAFWRHAGLTPGPP